MNLANKKLVIALSGGIDSVVLLHYCKKHNTYDNTKNNTNNIRAIHINHQLNPKAHQWQEFCKEFCKELKIPLTIFTIKINKRNNLEQRARELRYQSLFNDLAIDEILLTAHHQGDQAETVLLNLCRGSGVLGLAGMLEQNNQHYRPFLNKSKQWILDYAQKNQLQNIVDDSNFDTKFNRNFIRHKIIPILQQKYPQLEQTISKVADNMQQNHQLNQDLAQIDINTYNLIQDNKLDINGLKNLRTHRIINIIFYHLDTLKFTTPNKNTILQIIKEIFNPNKNGALIAWGEFEVRFFKNFIYFLPQKKPIQECVLYTQLKDKKDFNIRYKKNGQRIKFQHKTHSQSLKKLYQEYHIPPWERDNLRMYYLKDTLIAIEKIGFLQQLK